MCATGRELQMLTQDSCVFYNDHALYPYVLSSVPDLHSDITTVHLLE